VTVTGIDRLVRSTFDLFGIVKHIVDAKAQFRSLGEPWADIATNANQRQERIRVMPEEEIDEIVTSVFGLAAFHLQNSMLTALVAKGHVTMREAAAIASGAVHSLAELRPTPDGREIVRLAKQALMKLADGWQRQAKGN
jgi:hypothetical protein